MSNCINKPLLPVGARDSNRPLNLLVIMADEHRRDAMGCMGHAHVLTPHLDALAARGSLFTNAYTPSPICVSARAALATGTYAHRSGHWDSAAPYAGTPISWMHAVRQTGTDMVSIGKLHFRSTEDDNGFSQEILPMHVLNGVGWTVGLLRETPPPYDAAAELAADVGAGSSSYTDYDLAIADSAEKWLAKPARQTKPWAAFVSFVSPHYPLRAPSRFLDLYRPREMDTPIAYAPSERPIHPELQSLARYFDYDRYFDDKTMREAKAAYFGLVSFVDDCVGRVLAALQSTGQCDNTLVVYTSDHGEMLGDHGFWTKSVMYEAASGVPLIVAGPGVPVGRIVRTASSLLDVAATAAEVFQFPVNADQDVLPGRSLRHLATQADDPDRTVMSEYHDGGSSTGFFMIRWQQWKYVHYVNLTPQLFDLSKDPQELLDLASSDDPGVVDALAEGRRRLGAICDPDAVNARAFSDQRRRIEHLGGVQACSATAFNHTPAPTEFY